MTMKGLDLCEQYFNHFGMPMMMEKFHAFSGRFAAGLVGDGVALHTVTALRDVYGR